MKVDELRFDSRDGLIPVVVQDVKTREVLMLAYANREALERTLSTGFAHFWSRTRRKLWMKGEESGNTQRVEKILVDCDADALVYLVTPSGPACHTGNRTCFYRSLD
ncbi:MAG: phosphoribosyl-AMP cyclohydrolase [Aigarchaeota archaeon]|nr:phosphoribosyl-AMP cyclohydrolase [Candidatus Pelearchaeum maunauluense]